MPNDTSARAGGEAAPDWAEVRKEFPTTAKLTFLNSGMKVILPRCVAQAMQEWIDDVYDTAGETAFAIAEIERTRAAVAQAFGVPAAKTRERPWKVAASAIVQKQSIECSTS